MNRSNIGNVVTNGMQILSVGATTASKIFLGKADSALNNLTKEERNKYFQMRADKMKDEIADYYGDKKEIKENKEEIKEDIKTESFENPELAIKPGEINAPQGEETTIKINSDYDKNKKLVERFKQVEEVKYDLARDKAKHIPNDMIGGF